MSAWQWVWGQGSVMAIPLFLASVSALFAQTVAPIEGNNAPEPPDILTIQPDQALREEIASLIDRLDYPLHAERKLVTQKLMEINAPALPQLHDAYKETDDLEVRMRIEEIVHNIFFAYYVLNRNGFLGIRMSPYIETTEPGIQLPEGRVGMKVSDVIAGTGAERAGLRRDDVIIAVDDIPLHGAGRILQESFSKSIRTRRPGETIILTVVRGSSVSNMPATLGRTPEANARGIANMSVAGTTELYHELRREFPTWWADQFLRADTAQAEHKSASE